MRLSEGRRSLGRVAGWVGTDSKSRKAKTEEHATVSRQYGSNLIIPGVIGKLTRALDACGILFSTQYNSTGTRLRLSRSQPRPHVTRGAHTWLTLILSLPSALVCARSLCHCLCTVTGDLCALCFVAVHSISNLNVNTEVRTQYTEPRHTVQSRRVELYGTLSTRSTHVVYDVVEPKQSTVIGKVQCTLGAVESRTSN